VPVEDKTPTFREYTKEGDEVFTESSEDDDDDDDDDSDEEIQRYMNPDFDNAKGIKKIEYVSPAVIFNHLMQKSMKKKDKWIFVCFPRLPIWYMLICNRSLVSSLRPTLLSAY
jgi:hypothetical protein